MALYKEQRDKEGNLTGILVNEAGHAYLLQGASIPIASGNRDWIEYDEWTGSNTVDPADAYDHESDMKANRDARIHATDDTVMRDARQKRQGMDDTDRTNAPDAINDAELIVLDNYIKELADLPGLITSEGEVGAAGSFETPTWPEPPSFLP